MHIIDEIGKIKTEYINARPFSLDDTGVTHREITYWDEKDLLPVKNELNKWRRFSLVELAWIRFIANLRKLNVGLSTMQRIKKEMFADIALNVSQEDIIDEARKNLKSKFPDRNLSLQDNKDALDYLSKLNFSTFEFLLYKILLDGSRISIAISMKTNPESGEAMAVDEALFMEPIIWGDVFSKELTFDSIETLLRTCICISLNEIIADVYNNASTIKISKLFALSEQERKILEMIRAGAYREIHVRFSQNGTPDLLATIENINVNLTTRLIDTITRKSYEEYTIKTKDGEIVYAERMKNLKL